MDGPLVVGERAPAFTLQDDAGERVSLAKLRGRTVVLFFYADDDTPVCTQQACGFRDLHEEFAQEGAVVFGIGGDDVEKHAAFRRKHRLPFRLLFDPGHKISIRYGAYGEKVMYGRKVVGTIRSSVVIDPAGKIAAVRRRVQSKADAKGTLAALRKAR